MEYIPVRVSDLVRQVNRDIFLPAIQRELVWGTDRIERLFDSIMGDFPIGSFLYWRVDQENRDEWPMYEFIGNFDAEHPHNPKANMTGVMRDITLVLDGQQRISALYIGLKGSYRHFYYRWRTTRLHLNLLKTPVANDEDPEELTFGFSFRENEEASEADELWYPVGRILDFDDAEDAKADVEPLLSSVTENQRQNANKLIGRLHNRVHTMLVGNYYEEKSQDYEKVLQIFVRANSGGQTLEYSDLLLATATAKWETLDARREIHDFTDELNDTGNGYNFGKDFVLKASLYLCESLPIQYKVKNFTRSNLLTIEKNWEVIKESLSVAVRLISRFGFSSKNIVAPLAVLPIAFYLMKRGNKRNSFDTSSALDDAGAQVAIRKWFIFSTLKNAFGSSSDTTLARLREILKASDSSSPFPDIALYQSLGIQPGFSDAEVERLLEYGYQGRYTYLILSLLYPDRDWKDAIFHEDHIFPKTAFQRGTLRRLDYDDARIDSYVSKFNLLPNLQLLTDSENLSKNATPFHEWIETRDDGFKARHLIPTLEAYDMNCFERFFNERAKKLSKALMSL